VRLMVTQETQQFLNKFMEDNSPMPCVLVLLMTIVLLFFTPVGCLYPPPPLYPRGRGYKEGNQVSYNMISIRTLSLLVCFTYIFIDIIIYALGSMLWSSGIFWIVGQVIADTSLGLLSLCELVSWVPILVTAKWVKARPE
jgi:hypothetical protein